MSAHATKQPAIVLATGNKGKLVELRAMLAEHDIDVRGLDEFPDIGEIVESGATFEENALIKARAVCSVTGMIAVADDSGLAVDALSGAPGVHSARYSGEGATDASNNIKLLKALECVPEDKRTARFVCVMAAVAPNGAILTTRGEWPGTVLASPRGAGGFGYDPLFLDPVAGLTAAEMQPADKNTVSHRGRALKALMARWPDFWKKASD